MNRFFNTEKATGIIFATLISFFLVVLFTYAATTISANINTDGTLSVTGLSTLLGGATTTSITLLNGETISNATDGTIALTGAMTVSGNVTLGDAAGDAIALTGNASTTNSLTVGNNLYITGTASTTSLIVGGDSTNGTLAGLIHGDCNLSGVTANATTTSYADCSGAIGLRAGDKVFLNATSSIAGDTRGDVYVIAASSSAANTIGVAIQNDGHQGGNATINASLEFWAVR